MLRRVLLAFALFGILGSGSGCCFLDRLIHCEKYCGPSCGPKYWGPYCVHGCDPCDTCGNFVAKGYPVTSSRCGLPGYGCGANHGPYHGGGIIDDGYVDGGHYDGEIVYEGPTHAAPAHENAVYERPVHARVSNVTHHPPAPKRKIPHVWRTP